MRVIPVFVIGFSFFQMYLYLFLSCFVNRLGLTVAVALNRILKRVAAAVTDSRRHSNNSSNTQWNTKTVLVFLLNQFFFQSEREKYYLILIIVSISILTLIS